MKRVRVQQDGDRRVVVWDVTIVIYLKFELAVIVEKSMEPNLFQSDLIWCDFHFEVKRGWKSLECVKHQAITLIVYQL
jgi:hypothetical protein